jgi:hypothetical protein
MSAQPEQPGEPTREELEAELAELRASRDRRLTVAPEPTLEEPKTTEKPAAELELAGGFNAPPIAPSLRGRIRYAEALAEASMLPSTFRKQPGNVFFAVEYGAMLGIHPLTAIAGVHVVDGKPTASSSLVAGLVRRAGHRLRITKDVDQRGEPFARVEIRRHDDPEFPFVSVWTVEDAIKAKLLRRNADGSLVGTKDKSAWTTYLRNMLVARAITECARDACPEALSGLNYTPEELGAVVDVDGDVIEGELDPDPPQQQEQQRPAYTEEQLAAAARDTATKAQDVVGNAESLGRVRAWAGERDLLRRDVRPAIDRYRDAELRGRILAAAGALEPGVAVPLGRLLELLAQPVTAAEEAPAPSDASESPAPAAEAPSDPPSGPPPAVEAEAPPVPGGAGGEAVLALREALVSDDPDEVTAIYRSASPAAREVDVAGELGLVEEACLRGTGRLGDDRRLGAVLYSVSVHLRAGGKPLRDSIRDLEQPQSDDDGIIDAELVEHDGSAEDTAGDQYDPWAEQAEQAVPPLP